MRNCRSITDDHRLDDRFDRAALVTARPGHELGVHGWLEFAHPLTFVISKGHHHQRLALASTASVLNRAGAHAGAVFGRFDEDEIYAAALSGDDRVFGQALYDMSMAFVESETRFVVIAANGDDNPCDRLCRELTIAAARIASRRTRRAVATFNIESIASGIRPTSPCIPDILSFRLDESALARKLRAARAYPFLETDVERALALHGPEPLRVERFSPVVSDAQKVHLN